MKFEEFVIKFKANLDYSKTGMILFHNGIVRGVSRDGEKVNKLLIRKSNEKYRNNKG